MGDKKSNLPMKVVARQRAMPELDPESKHQNVVRFISPRELIVRQASTDRKYNFDHIFGEHATQFEVYDRVVGPYISSLLAGYNCTVLVYGQTNTGKMHTVFGDVDVGVDCDLKTDNSVGFVTRAGEHLFIELSKLSLKFEYTVRISFIELYNEEVRDLFDESTPLRIYDDPLSKGSICIKDLSKVTVFSAYDLNKRIKDLVKERRGHTFPTTRSHLMFTFLVNIKEVTKKGEEIIRTGRLNFVKLAGSENSGRSGTVDVRARESATINKSLVTVTKVIKALGQKLQHVPYRDSKLSRILQDSLGGNTKTCLLVTFSSSSQFVDETVTTLELANIAKSIVNFPQININKKQGDLLKELQDEIGKLKTELTAARGGEGFYVSKETYAKLGKDVKEHNETIIQLVRKIREYEEHFKTLDTQYTTLNESFLKTSRYLEAVKQELETKQEIIKEKKRELDNLTEKNREVLRKAKLLLGICEESTKDEAIYHQKYKERCQTNMNNTNASKDIKHISADGLKEIKRTTDTHFRKERKRMEDIKSSVKCLQEENLQGLKDSSWFNVKFPSLNMINLLRLEPEEFKRNLSLFTDTLYSDCKTRLLQSKDVNKTLDAMKADVTAATEEMAKQSTEVKDAINSNMKMQDDRVSVLQNLLSRILNDIHSRRLTISEQQLKEERWQTQLEEQYQRTLQERQSLQTEAEVLEEDIENMRELLDDKPKHNPFQHLEDILTQYACKPLEVIESQSKNMKETLDTIENAGSELLVEADACKTACKCYSDKIISNINTGLKEHKDHMQEAVDRFGSEVEQTEQVLEEACAVCNRIESDVTRVQDSQDQFDARIRSFIEQTRQKIRSAETGINFMGHAGDTPARRNYGFHEDIENIPPNNLSFSENSTRDDSQEEEDT